MRLAVFFWSVLGYPGIDEPAVELAWVSSAPATSTAGQTGLWGGG